MAKRRGREWEQAKFDKFAERISVKLFSGHFLDAGE